MSKFYQPFVLFTFVLIFSAKAQLDPLYNQYFFNQGMINPAYTGVHDVFNASAISRLQWLGIEGAPTTNTLNVSSSLFKNKVGLGTTLIYDTYGINNNTEFNISYAYKFTNRRGDVFSMGLQGGLVNYSYNYNDLNVQLVDDPLLRISQPSVLNPNVGLGLWYMSRKYYLGLSVPRMLNIEVADNNLKSTRYQRHYYFSAGYIFDQVYSLKFKPSILLMYRDADNFALDLNASFLVRERLWVGASIRNFSALGLNTQLVFGDNFKFGYSFEMPVSNISLIGLGSHSLMISLELEFFERNVTSTRYF